MNKVKQILSWLDLHGLFALSTFLIVFIPLFPKIPIFDVLPGYIVRARPEDILIFVTAIVWIKDAYKKRFEVSTTYFWIVVAYAISGATSILLGTVLIQSIPSELLHIGKSSLHLFRYLEYFALFFFTYSSIKTEKQLKIVLSLLSITVLAVVFYGFGQEFLKFPLYSTMNREYSKGVTLYLQEGARPQSTFAGHYDLAAYLVIVLPILFSLGLSKLNINFKYIKESLKDKSNYISAFIHLVHLFGAWMLVTSGSKTALFAYLVGIFIVLLQYLKKIGNLKQQLKWGSIATVISLVFISLFINFFAQSTKTQIISLIKNTFNSSETLENPDAKPDDLIGDGVIFKQIEVVNNDGSISYKWVEEQSTWSQNALKYGLSMGIRLDTLWPNAVKGFFNNPLFGNGYSTLPTVDNPGEYNNEDSTDNNFLRTLGETGTFGFILFYGLITLITIEVFKSKPTTNVTKALRAGFLGSVIGLLINAFYIDVFAASKVAYTFWTFAGLTVSVLKINQLSGIKKLLKLLFKHWPLLITIVAALLLLHKNPFHKYSLIKDLSVSNPQLESLTTAKCFMDTASFNLCRNNGLVLKENFNLYSLLLIPFLKVYNNPMMFYILNITLLLFVVGTMYKLIPILTKKFTKVKSKQLITLGSLLLYVLIITSLKYSLKPLTTLELLIFLVLIPGLIIIYTVFINNVLYRLAFFTQISAALVIMLFLVNQNFGNTFLNQFRNDVKSDKYHTLQISNVHFDTNRYLNREKDFYVITAMNPYYIDLFSNKNYDVLPLSEMQYYMESYDKVYKLVNNQEPLVDQYQKQLEDISLYASNYGVDENENLLERFNNIKDEFDLTYVGIGCEDKCSLFKLDPLTTHFSPIPYIANDKAFNLDTLNDSYSFAVVSNRFEPNTKYDQGSSRKYNTNQFAANINKNISWNNQFLILTGDSTNDGSPESKDIFNKLYNKLPIMYSAGNHDLYERKSFDSRDFYFFTDSELFIFVNVNEKSEVSQTQQLFIYNTLLKLEKLPDIENLFFISHNLDWQNRDNPNNFVFELERKLKQFPELNKYIITSYHTSLIDEEKIRTELTAKHITDEETNIHYMSSYIRDWDNDSFFEFTINQDNSVDIEYRVRGENF